MTRRGVSSDGGDAGGGDRPAGRELATPNWCQRTSSARFVDTSIGTEGGGCLSARRAWSPPVGHLPARAAWRATCAL